MTGRSGRHRLLIAGAGEQVTDLQGRSGASTPGFAKAPVRADVIGYARGGGEEGQGINGLFGVVNGVAACARMAW